MAHLWRFTCLSVCFSCILYLLSSVARAISRHSTYLEHRCNGDGPACDRESGRVCVTSATPAGCVPNRVLILNCANESAPLAATATQERSPHATGDQRPATSGQRPATAADSFHRQPRLAGAIMNCPTRDSNPHDLKGAARACVCGGPATEGSRTLLLTTPSSSSRLQPKPPPPGPRTHHTLLARMSHSGWIAGLLPAPCSPVSLLRSPPARLPLLLLAAATGTEREICSRNRCVGGSRMAPTICRCMSSRCS